ncbi:DUF6252 family protein [Psychroserpens sp.]|uniref:DUF6252 family protein n=1 Tax=Psychroserpens sp. TaxID=2020870 RepID=UPI003C7679D7
MRKLNVLLTVILLLVFTNCNSDDDASPQNTLSGFQAIIEGEIVDFEYSGGASMNSDGRQLSIPGIDNEGNQINIFIGENDMNAPVLTEGVYTANSNNTVSFAIDAANTFPNTQLFLIGGNNGSGEIIIENLDNESNIVTIKFSGVAGDNNGNTLQFSEGIAENIPFESF